VPRCLYLDLEPTVLDDIRSGPHKELYHPESFLHGSQDAANNFARGHYSIGSTVIVRSLTSPLPSHPKREWTWLAHTGGGAAAGSDDGARAPHRGQLLRAAGKASLLGSYPNRTSKFLNPSAGYLHPKSTHAAPILQGFAVFHSLGGGTGSGLGALLLEEMRAAYPKQNQLCYSVFPSPQTATAVVEPYNAVLGCRSLIEHADLVTVLDNEAVYDIVRTQLDVPRPSYRNLNRLISQARPAAHQHTA
jgi:hypothetical protein